MGEVLREEGVEERVPHADGGPAEPDEARGEAEFPVLEEGLDVA